MSDNWVVQNLENALETWNEKLSEIWTLITTTPQNFKGGNIWKVIVDINGAVQAIGLALLVLFFVIGMVKTCGSFTDVKKPEHALKLFVRFALAKGVITYGMELMLALFNIVQGTISTIMNAAGFGTPEQTTLPAEMVMTIEDCGFFESIPLWAVTLIGGLFITVLSFILIMTVYGRFFKLYMYTALAPIPLSTFAGEPTQNVGKSFIKSYCAVLLEGAVIVLACINETFVRRQIGSKRVSTFLKSDIKRFYNYLVDERGLKPATVDGVHNILHQIFDMAVDDNYIRNNPTNNVLRELKKAHCFKTEKRRGLTRPEQELFMDYLKNSNTAVYWYPVFAVMLGTGLRVGEVTGLRWCDIDLEDGIIDVNHTLVYYDHRTSEGKKGCYFNVNTPKTEAGNRQVPMLDFVKEAFRLLRYVDLSRASRKR